MIEFNVILPDEPDMHLKELKNLVQVIVRIDLYQGREGLRSAMRMLLLEDETTLAQAVRDHLTAEGHAVDWATHVSAANELLQSATYELALLDLRLPDGHGLELLREMRRRNDATPVIILTAQDRVSDRIEGLNCGADDYLVKPFDLAELSARISVVVRRYAGYSNPLVRLGKLEVDQAKRVVTSRGRTIDLTAREWAIFDQLLRWRQAIATKSQLEDALYAFGAEIESNTIEVYISRLRKKLGQDLIKTVRGFGYRLGAR